MELRASTNNEGKKTKHNNRVINNKVQCNEKFNI